jgi:hypothetical protein
MNNHSDLLNKRVDEILTEYMVPYDSVLINEILPEK